MTTDTPTDFPTIPAPEPEVEISSRFTTLPAHLALSPIALAETGLGSRFYTEPEPADNKVKQETALDAAQNTVKETWNTGIPLTEDLNVKPDIIAGQPAIQFNGSF